MKRLLAAAILLTSLNSFAQTTGTNTQIHTQESIERQKAADRQERANTENALKPNERSLPTKVDVSSWGLSDTKFDITNHLLGYSTILDSDKTLSGVKITGIINFAYYNITKKNADPNERSKARYVFGFETPFVDLTSRIVLWGGLGGIMGDTKALYADLGLDFILFSWFKIQGGMNYTTTGSLAPQISLGLVW